MCIIHFFYFVPHSGTNIRRKRFTIVRRGIIEAYRYYTDIDVYIFYVYLIYNYICVLYTCILYYISFFISYIERKKDIYKF